jgi:hypothetical protein
LPNERAVYVLKRTDISKKIEMSIRINDGNSFPEITAVSDFGGSSIEISNINDFDLGMFGNQSKIGGVTRSPGGAAPAPAMELKAADDIEFVNLEDTGVSFDVRPPPGGNDTIRIMRDNTPSPPKPIDVPSLTLNAAAPAPAPVSNPYGTYNSPAPAPAAAPAPANGGGIFSKLTGGWFGGNSAAAPAAPMPEIRAYLTPEEEHVQKMEGLTKLERMDRQGVGGTKMTIANSLDEINSEIARRKDVKALEASVRFQRGMLTTVVNGMEFLNSRYDPFGVELDGWSENVNENITDYDEIFEELYDKYKDKSKVAPEVRLIMSLGLSAAMCHVTNTMFKSKMPGMDDILRKNPDLARQMAQAAAREVSPGLASMMGGSSGGGGGMRMPSMHVEEEHTSFMPPMGSGIGAPIQSMDPRGGVDMNPAPTARREMRGPTGMDDIIRVLEANGEMPQRAEPPPPASIEADEINSVTSGFTTETMRRAGVSRNKRKATTTQPTGATLTLNV